MFHALKNRILETPLGYSLNQKFGQPTLDRYRQLIEEEVPRDASQSLLDLGCGIGAFHRCFRGGYTGVDINAQYVAAARARFPQSRFEVGDATGLPFADQSFDAVVSVATAHHLDDEQVRQMVAEALRVTRPSGSFHLIDPVMPTTPNVAFKTWLFRMDRGRFARTAERLGELAGTRGVVVRRRIVPGPLHDVGYFRIGREPSAPIGASTEERS